MNRSRALDRIERKTSDRIPHWESISNPDFEKALTGIDPYDHPQAARLRMLEMIPVDIVDVKAVPLTDDPIERLPEGEVSFHDEKRGHAARWGAGTTWQWDWGARFKSLDDVLKFDPLADMDLRGAGLVADYDYRLPVETLAAEFQESLDKARALVGERALVTAGFYNTLFMWPLLTFGWEYFLELGALHKDETRRLLRDFAERSRKVFQAWALTDLELFTSHDDICFQAGPVFNPKWLREFIYPYYEEFWGILRQTGKKIVFICDGNVNKVADDVFACGADGLRSECYTDWEAIAAMHPDKLYIGDGDNRVLSGDVAGSIEGMVRKMADFGRRYPGYFLSLGNHIPWNLEPGKVMEYFEASGRWGKIR